MTIEVRGIKVNYLHFGQGAETLLILQGWGTNAQLYRALAEHLGQHMQVLLPDLPALQANLNKIMSEGQNPITN